jgi:signal transduction histidine kinase
MEYRARMLGGELSIAAPRRGGTLVRCRVPLRQRI